MEEPPKNLEHAKKIDFTTGATCADFDRYDFDAFRHSTHHRRHLRWIKNTIYVINMWKDPSRLP